MSPPDKDQAWRPDPLPPRPPRDVPPPIVNPATAKEAFARAGKALGALATMREAQEEKETVTVQTMFQLYQEAFEAFDEVKRVPLSPEETTTWCALQDHMTVHSSARFLQAVREWGAIGRAAVARLEAAEKR